MDYIVLNGEYNDDLNFTVISHINDDNDMERKNESNRRGVEITWSEEIKRSF